jgi:CMP-N,N'-diacetyllegionaminic acid synthase
MTVHPILAVVPARGGSKGLPGKNVRPLGGIPLIAHSLRLAAMCPEIDRTIVSTDDPSIADIARAHGGDVPFLRPAEIARDETPMAPVLQHAVLEMERLERRRYGSVLLLDPTSPGRLPSDVTRAVELLDGDAHAQGVIACSKPTFNPFWVGVVERDGYLVPAFPGAGAGRRQDVPTFLRINGALYLWRRDFIARLGVVREEPQLLLEMPEARAFSIDDLHEFEVAEQLIAAGLVTLPWLADRPDE